MFGHFGDIEELYLFKDVDDEFKGSCFVKYVTRKEALKAIKHLNSAGASQNKLVSKLAEEGKSLEVRFADKKRKEGGAFCG